MAMHDYQHDSTNQGARRVADALNSIEKMKQDIIRDREKAVEMDRNRKKRTDSAIMIAFIASAALAVATSLTVALSLTSILRDHREKIADLAFESAYQGKVHELELYVTVEKTRCELEKLGGEIINQGRPEKFKAAFPCVTNYSQKERLLIDLRRFKDVVKEQGVSKFLEKYHD